MKKLLCLSLFIMGFFVSVEAQTLFYQITNNASADWTYGMEDGNGNLLNAITVTPGNTANGAFFNFALPIQYKAKNSIGCSVGGFILAPGGPVTPPFFCTAQGGFMTYQLTQVGFNYFLQVSFN